MNNTNVETYQTVWMMGKKPVSVTITANSISDEAIQKFANTLIELYGENNSGQVYS